MVTLVGLRWVGEARVGRDHLEGVERQRVLLPRSKDRRVAALAHSPYEGEGTEARHWPRPRRLQPLRRETLMRLEERADAREQRAARESVQRAERLRRGEGAAQR